MVLFHVGVQDATQIVFLKVLWPIGHCAHFFLWEGEGGGRGWEEKRGGDGGQVSPLNTGPLIGLSERSCQLEGGSQDAPPDGEYLESSPP